MSNQDSIKDTLNIIRKALEEENSNDEYNSDDILILDKLVNNDGTIKDISNMKINKNEIKELLNNKITAVLDSHFEKWLDKNMPKLINEHLNKK